MPLGGARDRKHKIGAKTDVPAGASLIQVPVRYALRLALLATAALLGQQTYADCLTGLLILSAAFCVGVAELRREPLFSPELTHWDEAAGYGIALALVSLAT